MNTGKPTPGWDQIMTLPRRLTIDPDAPLAPLRQEPAGDTDSLRTAHLHSGAMTLKADQEHVFQAVTGRALEIRAVFDPDAVPVIEMNVLRSRGRDVAVRAFDAWRMKNIWEDHAPAG